MIMVIRSDPAPPAPEMKSVRVNLPAADRAEVRLAAAAAGMSVSAWIRQAMRQQLAATRR